MTQPEPLKSDQSLRWSVGKGTEVWALFLACAGGDLATVQRLLAGDPNLVRSQFSYRTPLYFAVRENRLPVAALLLERGADPLSLAVNDTLLEICRDRGYAPMEGLLRTTLEQRFNAGPAGEPLAHAIRDRDLERVRYLLEATPALLHVGDERGNQPIHWAVMTRQLELIDGLVARGADLNARRFDGARPIHLTNGDYHYRGWRDVPKAVTTTPDEVYGHLVRLGAIVDLGMAAAKGDRARVVELLDADPASVNRVSEYGSYYLGCGAPLKNAAAMGQLEIVRLLLDRGADPNLPEEAIAPDGHALYAAVANRHHEIARLLIARGARPNAEVESSADALSRAISHDDRAMIDLLCAHGAARAVHLLAYYHDLRTAAAVFAANPALADDPEALGNAEQLDFVRLMLKYQPDLPKRVTISRGGDVGEHLLRCGMDPSRPDWLGVTPLHEFARRGDVVSAALFLDHGADLHARDEDLASSPLAWAAKFGRRRMVEFLLRRGARVRLPDDPPWATPLAWAERRGHSEIAEILRHHAKWGVSAFPLRLEVCERLVADWLEVFRVEGTDGADGAAAARRLAESLEIPGSPDAEEARKMANQSLRRSKSERDLSPMESRELVARTYGFADWHELERQIVEVSRWSERVPVWKAAEAAIIGGDDVALDHLLAAHPECFEEGLTPPYSFAGPIPDCSGAAKAVLLREHHFSSWDEFVEHRAAQRDPDSPIAGFEAAVDAVIDGNVDALQRQLAADADLIRRRSSRRHKATLLHYVGANGVEGFRQRTPSNAVAIAELLLRAGAEVDALATMYGGATTLGLAATSVHPWLTGVQQALLQSLLDHGASIDHPEAGGNHQGAVASCLSNGRKSAAEFLAARGARLDLATAAGVGNLDVIRRDLEATEAELRGSTETQVLAGLLWACQYGRQEVVDYLIDRGIEVGRRFGGETALHWAAFGGHPELVARLLQAGASVDVPDDHWRQTPLGWAIYGWGHPPEGAVLRRYHEVAAHLVGRGARVESEWLEHPILRARSAS